MKEARPYMLLGDGHRARVVGFVRNSVRQWSADWLTRETTIRQISSADTNGSSQWMVAESAPLYAVGIGCSQNWFDQASDLFAGVKPATESAERNSELTRALCDAALEALASILCGADGRLHRRQSGIVELMEAPGSGFLSFACSFEDSSAEIQIVGWPAWVASFGYSPSQINRKSEPLVPVANALGSESVLVSAIVGEAELPIGEFARLAVGDVLVVERLLEEPLAVQIDGGDVFAGGHLCAVDGMKAIELLPSNT